MSGASETWSFHILLALVKGSEGDCLMSEILRVPGAGNTGAGELTPQRGDC